MQEHTVQPPIAEDEPKFPEQLPVLPLRQGMPFPGLTGPLVVSRPD